jgi:hypothetical protein
MPYNQFDRKNNREFPIFQNLPKVNGVGLPRVVRLNPQTRGKPRRLTIGNLSLFRIYRKLTAWACPALLDLTKKHEVPPVVNYWKSLIIQNLPKVNVVSLPRVVRLNFKTRAKPRH